MYTLGLNLTGTPNGVEVLTVAPASTTAIYNAVDVAAETSQSNNTITFPYSTWDGSTDNDWSTAANWSSSSIPTSSIILSIPTGLSNYPTIATGTSAVSKTIAMASGTSLIASGTATLSGDITYTRGGLGTDWHLVSTPVVGEDLADVISNCTLATGTGSNVGLAIYNNSTPAWEYCVNSSTGAMSSGSAYSVKLSSGDLLFTGTMPEADVSAVTSAGSTSWNLIGNPYPSYIAINSSANSTNFIGENTSNLESSYVSIYVWDASTSQYAVINQASDACYLSPGQGFFVNVNSGVSSLAITESMQSHQSSETFYRSGSTSPTIKLLATKGDLTKTTTIKYFETASTGLDIGYDAGLFTGGLDPFRLSTFLVSDSEGIEFTLQALNINEFETSVIPVSLTAETGAEVIFSVESTSLPENMKVFLEDRHEDVLFD